MEIEKGVYDYKTESIENAFSSLVPSVEYTHICISNVNNTSLRAYGIKEIVSPTNLRTSGYIQFNRLDNEKLAPSQTSTNSSVLTIGGSGYCLDIEDLQPINTGFWLPLASIFCCVFIFYLAYKLILSRIWRRK